MSRFREVLAAGKPATAMWISLPWLPVVEILGASHCDAAVLDMEHSVLSIEDVERLCIACDAAGVTPLYRPPGLDRYCVSRALDAGAQGVIFPNVRTKSEAEFAVSCTRYPPTGDRPWAGPHNRANMFTGSAMTVEALRAARPEDRGVASPEYVARTNAAVFVALMVESPVGVENLDAILEVPGIDAIRFGWGDYSVHVGFDVDKIQAAADHVYGVCRQRGVGCSLNLGQADKHFPGCFYMLGVDALILSAAIRHTVGQARTQLGSVGDGSIGPLQTSTR
jgi:4-hydroxy-2-oxoheptanedioate aldolase